LGKDEKYSSEQDAEISEHQIPHVSAGIRGFLTKVIQLFCEPERHRK
jgi:hypothetical protein